MATRAEIHTVVIECPACSTPHDQVVALVTLPDALSPELRFTLPEHGCVSCGEPLNTEQIDDDVRDTVSVMLWAAHHERGAA